MTRAANQGARQQRSSIGDSSNRAHEFVWNGAFFVCIHCRRFKKSSRSVIDKSPCGTLPLSFRSLLGDQNGHSLWVTQELASGTFGLFCQKCGAFAFSRPNNLMRPCPKVCLGKGTFYRRKLIRNCKHPLFPKVALTKPWPLRSHPVVEQHGQPLLQHVLAPHDTALGWETPGDVAGFWGV